MSRLKTFGALAALALAAACAGTAPNAAAPVPTGNGPTTPGPTPPGPAVPGQYDLLTEVQGLPVGNVVHATSVSLTFDLAGTDKDSSKLKLDGFECQFSATAAWKPCNASALKLSDLFQGAVLDLRVRARVLDESNNGTVLFAKEADIHLTVADDAPAQGSALASKLQVGSTYELAVPVGMHITEYSTSKTTGVLSVFQILPESDPYYLGNHSCTHDWDREVPALTPAGESLLYCHSTPTRDQYKNEQEERLANNHVEIATDTQLVAKGAQERLALSVYDEDFELTPSATRFQAVCGTAEKHSLVVPMIPSFFLQRTAQNVDFWMCDVNLPDMDGSSVRWRVGAFFDIDHVDHLDFGCSDCRYPQAVEAVYMSRANVDNDPDADFAKVAQERLLDVFSKLTP